MTGTPRSTANWSAIEREYRAGKLSVSKIAQKHGISHTAINKRAAKEGWKRKGHGTATGAKAPHFQGSSADPIPIGELTADVIETLSEGEAQEKPRVGRPTLYKPEYAEQARKLYELGATDYEVADFFGVELFTIHRWRAAHKPFCEATVVGKEPADDRVERSLFQRAVGYTYESEKVFQFQGQIVRAKTVEHVPPDTAAAGMWLNNRRRDEWRNRREVEVGGPGDFDRMSDGELRDFIASRADPNRAGNSRTRKSH